MNENKLKVGMKVKIKFDPNDLESHLPDKFPDGVGYVQKTGVLWTQVSAQKNSKDTSGFYTRQITPYTEDQPTQEDNTMEFVLNSQRKRAPQVGDMYYSPTCGDVKFVIMGINESHYVKMYSDGSGTHYLNNPVSELENYIFLGKATAIRL